jgi:hypothetical protein
MSTGTKAPTVLGIAIFVVVLLAGGNGCSGSSEPAQMDAGQFTFSLGSVDAGCLGSSLLPPGPEAGVTDPLCVASMPTVSYSKDVAPIFAGCAGEVCHAPWTFSAVVGQQSIACCDHRWLVEPFEPSASLIVQAVDGTGCVPQMPMGGSLADPDIATLTAWVCQGALNN